MSSCEKYKTHSSIKKLFPKWLFYSLKFYTLIAFGTQIRFSDCGRKKITDDLITEKWFQVTYREVACKLQVNKIFFQIVSS